METDGKDSLQTNLVKEQNLPLSAHFQESLAERQWLDSSTGEFAPFFENFLQQKQSVTSAKEFLTLLDDTPALMVHGGYATEEELQHEGPLRKVEV